MAVGGAVEIGVQGDDEVELREETEEGREEEGEGEVGVCEAEEAEGVRGYFFQEGDGGGVLVDGEGGAEEREDAVVMEEGVGYAAEEIDADAKGVDVVHAEVIGDHVGKGQAPND